MVEGGQMARRMRRTIARRRRHDEDDALLRTRIDQLEKALEALQDSVYKDVVRQDERIDELARRLDPPNLVRAISEDARRRGL
jgi:hypothetical protein